MQGIVCRVLRTKGIRTGGERGVYGLLQLPSSRPRNDTEECG